MLLATHDGLYAGQRDGWKKVSPTIDLMGFTAVGSTLYSSGHPGDGSDLPNPVGLLRSDDQGRTWQTQSLAGKSDFHALAAARDLLVGYDGTLRTSHDAKTWTDGSLPGQPMSLSASLDGATVLASGQQGTWTSIDQGGTWKAATGTLPVVSGVANPRDAYGLAGDGSLVASHDGGTTWVATGQSVPSPEMLAVTGRGEILVATADGVVASTDGGKSTHAA